MLASTSARWPAFFSPWTPWSAHTSAVRYCRTWVLQRVAGDVGPVRVGVPMERSTMTTKAAAAGSGIHQRRTAKFRSDPGSSHVCEQKKRAQSLKKGYRSGCREASSRQSNDDRSERQHCEASELGCRVEPEAVWLRFVSLQQGEHQRQHRELTRNQSREADGKSSSAVGQIHEAIVACCLDDVSPAVHPGTQEGAQALQNARLLGRQPDSDADALRTAGPALVKRSGAVSILSEGPQVSLQAVAWQATYCRRMCR